MHLSSLIRRGPLRSSNLAHLGSGIVHHCSGFGFMGFERYSFSSSWPCVMWESRQRFPRAGGRVGKRLYRFPMLSTARHFHGLWLCV
jgi:hypothetical protein